MTAGLLPLLNARRVLVCVGSGGVGKTTVAASLALAAALGGRRVLCLTIDPARRLANSLGLGRMTIEEQRVAGELFERAGLSVPGELVMMMLDTKRTFDRLVERHASTAEVRDRILENRLYHYVSTSLAGTHSYMAMERLLEAKNDPRYDLIVLDTPPTAEALDFLSAPERMIGAIDSPALRWFIQAFSSSGRLSLNLLKRSAAVVLRALGRFTGPTFLERLAELITDLNDLFGGFRSRATEVARAFRGTEFGYILVTTPNPGAIQETTVFAQRFRSEGMHADAVVVNRVHRFSGVSEPVSSVASSLAELDPELAGAAPRVVRAARDEDEQARHDAYYLAELYRAIDAHIPDGAPLRIEIPAQPADVHDLRALSGVASVLCPACTAQAVTTGEPPTAQRL
jgi:anion-transporting  ArsA/GET3 family ATPase